MKLLVSPHNDDETLFGAFTLLREKCLVVVVFDGYVQGNRGLPVTAEQRRKETDRACRILQAGPCYQRSPSLSPDYGADFLGFRDDAPPAVEEITDWLLSYGAEAIYAPAWEPNGHPQHNLVACACDGLPVVERYMTYTPAGKSISNRPVEIKDGSWIALKHRALACYESQMNLDPKMGCWPHFMRDIIEYYA